MKVRNWFIRTTYPDGRTVVKGVKKAEFDEFAYDWGFVDGQETFSLKILHSNHATTPEGTLIEGWSEEFEHTLPRIVPMEPLPAESNPFHHDMFNMGCEVSGPWMAMYSEHAGHKQEHNKSEDEKGKPVWNKDPEYIILVNQRTGQRFRLDFTTPAPIKCKHCGSDLMQDASGLWYAADKDTTLMQYCWVDPEHGSKLHEPAPQ